ncbi:MAG TPA: tetratricopeptide repeat protein, partial [Herpetosiphonaceae bacterium]|nr:tetratricopeptide repeat protein [Herpetosiphonaceae bacterium]
AIQRRHADHYCALAEAAEEALKGDDQARWLARLDDDYPHLRAALRWGLDQGAPELAARIAGALWRFWHLRGYHAEGGMWLAEAVSRRASLPDDLQAKVLNCLGQVLLEQARYGEAWQRFEQGLELQRRLGNRLGVARILNNLGMIAENQGDFDQARRLHGESLELKRELGDPLATANSLNNLGIVLEAQGNYAEAWGMLEEGLALRRAHGDHWSVAVSLLNLAQVAYRQGNYRAALALLRESVELRQALADTTGIAWSLEGIANVAAGLHGWVQAVRLWGAAAALRSALGSPLPPSQRTLYDQNIALARSRLSAQDFAGAWHAHAGRALEDLVEEALSLCRQLEAADAD